MKHYWNPEIKDVMSEIEVVQKQLEELKPRILSAEHVAQALGWASLKQDIEGIKDELASLNERLSQSGL